MSDTHRAKRDTIESIRARIGSVVWLAAATCALFLVLGALLIALKANPDSSIRNFVVGGADLVDGPFSRNNGLFTFDGAHAAAENALVNWGIAAVIYLLIGKLLRRVIRPS